MGSKPWRSRVTMETAPPDPWFHDVFHPDGRPYDEDEAALNRELTGR